MNILSSVLLTLMSIIVVMFVLTAFAIYIACWPITIPLTIIGIIHAERSDSSAVRAGDS